MKTIITTGLTRGKVANSSGVNLETIRYYERRGLLAKPPRTASGYRSFPMAAVRRVKFIKHAQALGFTLSEIKKLLALRINPETTCAEVRKQAKAKVANTEQKIQALIGMKASLEQLALEWRDQFRWRDRLSLCRSDCAADSEHLPQILWREDVAADLRSILLFHGGRRTNC